MMVVRLISGIMLVVAAHVVADWEKVAMAESDTPLTAEVVLVSPQPGVSGPITSENVRERLPLPDQVARAQSSLARLGFSVGRAAGVGFSITAPKNVFEQVFQVRIVVEPNGLALLADAPQEFDLPLAALPDDLRQVVAAVGFQRPLDFGPTGSFR
jgi:hypothetical protein